MLSIGDVARLGHLSVRMLRHYDGIGLLSPSRVDPVTGYRWYDATQLSRLNRVLALKDLGFTLDQVRTIVDGEIGPEELRGMLRLRQSELVAQIEGNRDRLARVERRLRTIESEGTMQGFDVRAVEAVRVAARSTTVDGIEQIGQVVGPNFEALARALRSPLGPPIAFYDVADDGHVRVSSAFPHDGAAGDGFEVVELPSVARAAVLVHRGGMDTIGDTWQELVRQVEQSGEQITGMSREVYLQQPTDDPDAWVTELQQPLV